MVQRTTCPIAPTRNRLVRAAATTAYRFGDDIQLSLGVKWCSTEKA